MKNEDDDNNNNPLQPDFTVVDLAATVFLLIVLGSGCIWVYENFFAPSEDDLYHDQLRKQLKELDRLLNKN
jgi:hypothetical protein